MYLMLSDFNFFAPGCPVCTISTYYARRHNASSHIVRAGLTRRPASIQNQFCTKKVRTHRLASRAQNIK
jgi:hypothetical protein